MRRKKNVVKKRSRSIKLKLFVTFIVLFSIPITLYLLQNEQRTKQNAQEVEVKEILVDEVRPTYSCISPYGGCPTVTASPPKKRVIRILVTKAAGIGAAGSSQNVASTTNTCGRYKLNNTKRVNFGDPQCNFDKNKLYEQLKQIDPANASKWFNQVIPCESGFNPNAFNGGAVDSGGAWGLFQMGQGKNGPTDRGDVVWGLQAKNAVDYRNIKIKGSWRYWACAR